MWVDEVAFSGPFVRELVGWCAGVGGLEDFSGPFVRELVGWRTFWHGIRPQYRTLRGLAARGGC